MTSQELMDLLKTELFTLLMTDEGMVSRVKILQGHTKQGISVQIQGRTWQEVYDKAPGWAKKLKETNYLSESGISCPNGQHVFVSGRCQDCLELQVENS